jgi:thiosulfate/3-mercaptopyruvate sulfurtransferase
VERADDGTPFFKSDPSQMMVRIGQNPIQNAERPWDFVVLRHVPIARDTFAYYGEALLPNFDSRPTWTYATPHSIQRVTPQNSSCSACHDNPSVFLTADDVDPDELAANRDVIVTEVP